MKNLLFISIIFFLFSCGSKTPENSSDLQKSKEQKTKQLTEFEFSEEMHNFGSLQSGEIVVYTFEFKNSGENDLIINDVETDCGCVKTNFTKEPVLPGKTGIIEVEFDSAGLWGKQFKAIEIHANTKKTKQLAILAEVQNEQLEIKY